MSVIHHFFTRPTPIRDAPDTYPSSERASMLAQVRSGCTPMVVGVDAFLLFSSSAGVLGSGLQGAYSAANAFLDVLSEQPRVLGRSATSIAWCIWNGGGIVDHAGKEHLRRRGVSVMPLDLALAASYREESRGGSPQRSSPSLCSPVPSSRCPG
ncbi:KR domain-containing protein [Sorangium cellulosum]|nr:reductase [Sorangium cellulosum]